MDYLFLAPPPVAFGRAAGAPMLECPRLLAARSALALFAPLNAPPFDCGLF